jgi:NitT/TauT family transport system substrate-binding protein
MTSLKGAIPLLLTLLLTACGGSAAAPAASSAAPASSAPASAAAKPSAAAPASSAGSAPAKPAVKDVTVGIPSQSLSHFPLVVGRETGIFARHGINLSITQMKSDVAIAGTISGQVNYSTPAGSLIRAIGQGAPLKLVVTIMDKSNHLMIVNPKVIAAGKDLAGKRVAVNGLGDNTQYEAEAVLEHYGIDKKNVQLVVVPDEGPKAAALQAGSVDAAIMSLPFKAEELGFKTLIGLVDILELPTSIVAASNQDITGHPADVQNMVDASLESLRYTRDHKAESLPILQKTFDLDAAQANRAYDISRDAWSATGILSPTAFKNVLDPLNLNPPLTIDKAWDQEFIDRSAAK